MKADNKCEKSSKTCKDERNGSKKQPKKLKDYINDKIKTKSEEE